MVMTKFNAQHYTTIATEIKNVMKDSRLTEDEKLGVEHLAICLASMFGHDNPRFDRDMFLNAALVINNESHN